MALRPPKATLLKWMKASENLQSKTCSSRRTVSCKIRRKFNSSRPRQVNNPLLVKQARL